MTNLSKSQIKKLDKIAGYERVQPIVRVSDLDGYAEITFWFNPTVYREITMTKGGKVISDSRGVAA